MSLNEAKLQEMRVEMVTNLLAGNIRIGIVRHSTFIEDVKATNEAEKSIQTANLSSNVQFT